MISSRNILFNIVNKVVNQKLYHCLPELIDVLNKYQSCLSNLLENDPKNNIDRNLLLNSLKEPIKIAGIPQKVSLSQDYIQEAIIISDMFKLNEITSVELLMSGEADSTANPDMTRGLIAVLNYYYSQKTIVEALRILLQAKLIITEESAISLEVVTFIETYLANLFQTGLFSRLLSLIKSMNIEKEVNMLESQMALGSARHRRQFYVIFDIIRKNLCDCVMLRSYETPLNKKETTAVICLLRELYQENKNVKKEEATLDIIKPKINVDQCFVYLLISLISSTNPIIEGNSVENFSKKCLSHPFFIEDDYQKGMDKILRDNLEESLCSQISEYDNKNIVQNIDQILYLSWIISLQKVSHLKKETSINVRFQKSTSFGDYDDFVDLEVLHIDCQYIYECFQFLIQLINIEGFHEENIWVKCLHDLITDFIVFMPKMLKDLRTESTRELSNVHYFSSLLDLIGSLYGGPRKLCEQLEAKPNQLLESLVLEYWSPNEIVNCTESVTLFAFEENFKNWKVKSNDSYKQSVLFKFIRDSGDLIDIPQLFISYVFMLKGLCCSDRISLCIYSLLNNNQMSNQTSKLTWEWFSNSLQNHAKFLISTTQKLHTMCPSELQGLLEVLQLIKRVTQHSRVVCTSMISNESLMLAQNIIVLLSCRVPEILKAELLNCLAVFCTGNGLIAKSIWQSLESNNIITRPSHPMSSSILIELDQIEPKSQEFFITRAFLKLLLAEVDHIVSNTSLVTDQPLAFVDQLNQTVVATSGQYQSLDHFTNVLHMVMETVFLKHAMRTYKNIEEKFVVSESFLELCCKCVDLFLAKVGNIKLSKGKLSWCQYDPGFFIVSQLLNDSLFLKTLISIIDNGFVQINDGLNNLTFGSKTLSKDAMASLQNSIYYAMHLLWTVLDKESSMVHLVRELNSKTKTDTSQYSVRGSRFRNFIPQELTRLLMSSSSANHFLPNLIKYISIVDETERISRKALSILYSCINIIEPHSNLMLMLTNRNVIDIDILPLFVNCIDKFGDVDPIFVALIEDRGVSTFFFNNPSTDSPRTLVLKMLISCLEKPAPNLGHHLMGFSCESVAALKRTSLQEAGVGDCTKSCLHSLLNLVNRLSSDIISNPCYDNPDTPSDQLADLTVNLMDLTLAFRILHLLASDPNTSLFVLRFIRSNYQLIFNQMDLLSFNTNKVAAIPELRALFWNQKSWLLKIIAIELRQCTANQQRSYVSKLLKLLFGDDLFENNNETVFSKFCTEELGSNGLIYQLLEDVDVSESEEFIDFSGCQRFKPNILKEYLNQCFEESYMDLRLMNSDGLKQSIFADINLSVEEEHLVPLQREIDNVCHEIAKYNTNEIWLMFGKNSLIDGWRQVVEIVMVTDCSGEDTITVAVKTRKICETLTLIMEKILVPTTPNALVIPLSRACLILTAVLGGMFVGSNDPSAISGQLMPDDIVDVHAQKLTVLSSPEMETQFRHLMQLTSDCILKINAAHQNTRIKFYGVLTYLIQIVLKLDSTRHDRSGLGNDCSPSFDCIPQRSLYPAMCRDAVSGNIHLALSSLTLLDCIASIDRGHGDLVPYVVTNGYLQHLIDSLDKDCANVAANIKRLLVSQPMQDSDSAASSIPYYLYQSKMSLFCKWATQVSGSRALVQYGLLSCLSRCDLFRVRPSPSPSMPDMAYDELESDDCDDAAVQYRNVLSLALQLAGSILSSQGLDKPDTVREVLSFVGEFIDVLCAPFQSSTSALSGPAIKEMIVISSLFVTVSSSVLRTEVALEFQYGTLDKIKTASSQMLACLLGLLNEQSQSVTDTMQYLLQIQLMGNLLSIVAGIVSAGSVESHKMLYFSNNIDGVLACRSNWSSTVKKICQKIMSGEKPPLSLLVMTVYKVQECYTDIRQKISRFVSSELDMVAMRDTENMSLEEVTRDLDKMSTDQLRVLWTGIFDSGLGIAPLYSHSSADTVSMDCLGNDLCQGSLAAKNDLVRDLLALFKRLTNVARSLTVSLECCCFLLWHHLAAYKALAAPEHRLHSSGGNVHPIRQLQILEQQQTKLDMLQYHSRNNSSLPSSAATVDLVAVVAQCVDESLLNKMEQSLAVPGDRDHASFSKVIIHRLARMLQLA